MVLPAVPAQAITHPKAAEAVSVLVELLQNRGEAMSVSSFRAVVKCLGVLVGFCDSEDWDSVKLGFETLLKFSVDKRPKVWFCPIFMENDFCFDLSRLLHFTCYWIYTCFDWCF